MPEKDSTPHPIPLLRGDEEQLTKIRKQLESMFQELDLVNDILIVIATACDGRRADTDIEMEHVIRRCAHGRLFRQMRVLTTIIARFGGKTYLGEDDNEAEIAEGV